MDAYLSALANLASALTALSTQCAKSTSAQTKAEGVVANRQAMAISAFIAYARTLDTSKYPLCFGVPLVLIGH